MSTKDLAWPSDTKSSSYMWSTCGPLVRALATGAGSSYMWSLDAGSSYMWLLGAGAGSRMRHGSSVS